MTEPTTSVCPYQLAYSEHCRQELWQFLVRAILKGRDEEVAEAARGVHTRLEWIPHEFGEPTRTFVHLGLQEYIATIPPLVVTYTADESRRIVYVTRPFMLLPNSDL